MPNAVPNFWNDLDTRKDDRWWANSNRVQGTASRIATPKGSHFQPHVLAGSEESREVGAPALIVHKLKRRPEGRRSAVVFQCFLLR